MQQVQEYVQQQIKTAGSQNKAATQLGISSGHIGNLRDGNWAKVSRKLFNEVAVKTDAWDTIPTNNFRKIMSIAKTAQDNSKFLGITGFTGAGKTHSLKYYSNRTLNAHYVLVDIEMNKKRFLSAIQKALGIGTIAGGQTASEMVEVIIRTLSRQTKPLLILDDSGKLNDTCYRIIQIIYDRTERQAGILLAGTEYLKEYIYKMARKDKLGFRELARRVASWQDLRTYTLADVTGICQQVGVEDETAISYLYKNTNDYGTLRNILDDAIKSVAKSNEIITRELLFVINKDQERWNL